MVNNKSLNDKSLNDENNQDKEEIAKSAPKVKAGAHEDKTILGNIKPKRTPTVDTASLSGKILKNRYELEAHIGSGGMSDIYKAKDLLLTKSGVDDPYVAIKVLQQQYTKNKEAQQLLFREAHKTMALSHPNIIRVYDVDKEDNLCFIIMEWLDGETLDQVISRSKPKGLTYNGADKIISQVAEALKFAHQNDIVHTDLKPSNIMLTRNGDIKVFDFGVARLLQNNYDQFSTDSKEQNTSLGGYTPAYASIELLKGKQPSESDDLFSLGCIFYELVSSKHPYNRKPADQAAKAKATSKKPNKLNSKQWKLLRSALAFSRKERPDSVAQWQQQYRRTKFPFAASVLPILAIAGAMTYFYYSENAQNDQALITTQQQTKINALSHSSVEVFMNSLAELDKESDVVKAGILRQKRNEVIDYHIAKINRILQNPKARYPDFYQIMALLEKIKELYPDSLKISDLVQYVEHQQDSVRAVLLADIDSFLKKAEYQQRDDGVDIFSLQQDMRFIDRDYVIVPSQQAIKLYRSKLLKAIKNYDYQAISTLLPPGKLLFKDSVKEVAELLEQPQLTAAIAKLTAFDESSARGKAGEYPIDAAAVFYQSRFEQWTKDVKKAQSLAALDRVYRQLENNTRMLPDTFEPLSKIRRDLGNRYLKLIVTGKIQSTPQVIQKAEMLFSKAE